MGSGVLRVARGGSEATASPLAARPKKYQKIYAVPRLVDD